MKVAAFNLMRLVKYPKVISRERTLDHRATNVSGVITTVTVMFYPTARAMPWP